MKEEALYSYRIKGLSPLLSGVLYMTIIIVGISIVMMTLYPKILDLKEYSKISNTIRCTEDLNSALLILEKASVGSEQEVRCKIRNAKLLVKNNALLFIIPYVEYLHLDIFKDKEHTLNEGVYVYDNGTYFLMGNKYIEINFSKIQPNENINISHIINKIRYKSALKEINGSSLYFILNEDSSIGSGKGYTIAESYGMYLKYGKIIAHVENNNARYNLTFILYPSADYLVIGIEE